MRTSWIGLAREESAFSWESGVLLEGSARVASAFLKTIKKAVEWSVVIPSSGTATDAIRQRHEYLRPLIPVQAAHAPAEAHDHDARGRIHVQELTEMALRHEVGAVARDQPALREDAEVIDAGEVIEQCAINRDRSGGCDPPDCRGDNQEDGNRDVAPCLPRGHAGSQVFGELVSRRARMPYLRPDSNGFNSFTPKVAKSSTLRVTTVS